MKKINLLAVLFLALAFGFTACDDDPDPTKTTLTDLSVSGFSVSDGFSDGDRIYTNIGATITFEGEGFSPEEAENEVTVGGEAATVTSVSDTELVVEVPELAALGLYDVSVTVGDNTFSAAETFKVFPSNTVFVEAGDIDNATWTSDNVYVIDGFVFVGGSLTIDPGTVVMGVTNPFANDNATSLIISRGATIDAEGTAQDPIILTSESDQEALGGDANLDGTDTKGWAGLIVLGEAVIGAESSELQIEGIPDGEDRALYGGTNDADNSGILKYVSIRFSGAEIGPGDEIQGLTLGGVGSGTTIEYIDIFASSDDGIEIFGGAVNIRYISVAFAEDDSFDFDTGWNGMGQFLFGIQRSDDADHGGEWDGAKPDDNPRYVNARIYNATILGRGKDEATEDESESQAILMRDGNAISLYNSIIGDFKRRAIQIEDNGEDFDSYDKLIVDGLNEIGGNIFFELEGSEFVASDLANSLVVATGSDAPWDATAAEVAAHLVANDNIYLETVAGINPDRTQGSNGLSVVPSAAEATSNIFQPTVDAAANDNAVVNYKGAFEPGQAAWINGWTTLSRFGYLAE